MTTTQQTALHLAARHLVEAQEQAASLGKQLTLLGETMFTEAQRVGAILGPTLNALGRALEAAGATASTEGYQGAPPPAPDSLEALRRIEKSRPEGEQLAYYLQQTLYAAQSLDRARGNWVGDMASTAQGETPGTDYAESVQALLLRLRGELGAEGEGRE